MGHRGPVRRRTYSPTDAVYAREDLRFSGRAVATRAQVPEGYFRSARDRRVLWDAGKLDHAADMPVKVKREAASVVAPAPVPAPIAEPSPVPVSALAVPAKESYAAADAAARVYGLKAQDFGAPPVSPPSVAPAALPAATAQATEAAAAPPRGDRRGRSR